MLHSVIQVVITESSSYGIGRNTLIFAACSNVSGIRNHQHTGHLYLYIFQYIRRKIYNDAMSAQFVYNLRVVRIDADSLVLWGHEKCIAKFKNESESHVT